MRKFAFKFVRFLFLVVISCSISVSSLLPIDAVQARLPTFFTFYPNFVHLTIGESTNVRLSNPENKAVTWELDQSSPLIASYLPDTGLLYAFSSGYTKISASIGSGSTKETTYCHILVTSNGRPANGTYFIKNIGNDRLITYANPTGESGLYISQRNVSGSMNQQWFVTMESDGYCTIRSGLSYMYLSVNEQTGAVQAVSSSVSDNSKWKIKCVYSPNSFSDGEDYHYVISPKLSSYSNKFLSVSSTNNTDGAKIVLSNYVDDTSYTHWRFYDYSEYDGVTNLWNSDEYKIGYHEGTVTMYSEFKDDTSMTLDNTFEEYFDDAYPIAKQMWADALDVTVSDAPESTADIVYYGITTEDYYLKTGQSVEGWIGLTVYNEPQYVGYRFLSGSSSKIINVYEFHNQITVYVLCDYPSSLDVITEVFVHEMGHALGYMGHSTNTTDVMWKYAHTGYTLSDTEKQHLYQIYRTYN